MAQLKFEQLVNDSSVDPRLKLLWCEIYRNVTFDREQVSIFVTNLQNELQTAQTHIAFGPQITKYLELVKRSNDQLLKLAEQIRMYNEEEGDIDTDNLLDEINAAKGQ